jgi:superfamily II RNA helicase
VCPICHQKIPDDRLAQHIAFHEKYDQGIKKQATSDNQAMSANIAATLNTRFGLATFRPGQAEAIQNLLAGQHTLVVMPTGAGKSLVYQLADPDYFAPYCPDARPGSQPNQPWHPRHVH